MFQRIFATSLMMAVLVFPVAIAAQEDNEPPELVLAEYPALHPEGVDWAETQGVFVTGSVTAGGVFTVEDDGTTTQLGEGVDGLASLGVHVDVARNRVLAAMMDFEAGQNTDLPGVAALAAYDLDTGEELFFVDLSDLDDGRDFGNDVTVDADGNAYMTNSYGGIIYKVDTEGNGEIFIQADDFAVNGLGLNGIDYNPDTNSLMVAVTGSGALYSVPLDDPESYTQVALEMSVSIDGMVYKDGYLYAVTRLGNSRTNVVAIWTSDDDWASARLVSEQETQAELSATTLTIRDGFVYVVYAKFGSIGSDPAVETFEIERFVAFSAS